jgi:hypothetical protein
MNRFISERPIALRTVGDLVMYVSHDWLHFLVGAAVHIESILRRPSNLNDQAAIRHLSDALRDLSAVSLGIQRFAHAFYVLDMDFDDAHSVVAFDLTRAVVGIASKLRADIEAQDILFIERYDGEGEVRGSPEDIGFALEILLVSLCQCFQAQKKRLQNQSTTACKIAISVGHDDRLDSQECIIEWAPGLTHFPEHRPASGAVVDLVNLAKLFGKIAARKSGGAWQDQESEARGIVILRLPLEKVPQ